MADFASELLDAVALALANDEAWASTFAAAREGAASIHLAILIEPYLQFLLDGHKTIESRFAKTRQIPHGRVEAGDLVILKRSGGPVVGLFEVGDVHAFELGKQVLADIRQRYATAICATGDDFWWAQAERKHATLMGVHGVRQLPDLPCAKTDPRPWVILSQRRPAQLELLGGGRG